MIYKLSAIVATLLIGCQPQMPAAGARQHAAEKAQLSPSSGKKRYVMPIPGCPVEFVADRGGDVGIASQSSPAAAYFHIDATYGDDGAVSRNSYSFPLACYPANAREMCAEEMKDFYASDADPERRINLKVRHLTDLHAEYYTDAFLETAPQPPRPRMLSLCMGDDKRTLIAGVIDVGYDAEDPDTGLPLKYKGVPTPGSEEDLPMTLDIIRSIRFLPASSEPQEDRD